MGNKLKGNIFLYLGFALLIGSNSQGQDIRNCKWKMTMKQVLACEKGKYMGKEEDALAYNVVVDGDPFGLAYFFQKDSLVQAVLVYSAKHLTAQTYYERFKAIKTKLAAKYGKGSDETVWVDELFKDDPSKYGLAASMGHVKFIYKVVNSRTSISLSVTGEDYECRLGVIYRDINYVDNETTEF